MIGFLNKTHGCLQTNWATQETWIINNYIEFCPVKGVITCNYDRSVRSISRRAEFKNISYHQLIIYYAIKSQYQFRMNYYNKYTHKPTHSDTHTETYIHIN